MNTVEVIDAVKERLDRARELLPPDVTVEVLQDQSRYIRAALHEIQNHLDLRQHHGQRHRAAVHAVVAVDASSRRWRFPRRSSARSP